MKLKQRKNRKAVGVSVHWQWPRHKYNGKDYKLSKSDYELIKMIKHN